MFLKLMSDENIPDFDNRKSFRLLAHVSGVYFNRSPEAPKPSATPRAYVNFDDGESAEYDLDGSAYVLNDEGKTIEKFIVAHPSARDFPASA